MNIDEAIKKYGKINNGFWPEANYWCRILGVPPDIAVNWINTATGKPTTHIYCNKDFLDPLLNALIAVRLRGLLSELHTFDGCSGVREVRGEPGKLSAHSWGIAIDINASENALGTEGGNSPELVKCFTDQGLIWGGSFPRKDPMHFSLGW